MSKFAFWPPRFSLRALLLFVLAAAIVFAGFESWRLMRRAQIARAEFARLMHYWNVGVIATPDLLAASQHVFDAERRQWFSSAYEQAIAESHILRLAIVRDKLRYMAENGLHASEEELDKARRQVDDVSRLITGIEDRYVHPYIEPPLE